MRKTLFMLFSFFLTITLFGCNNTTEISEPPKSDVESHIVHLLAPSITVGTDFILHIIPSTDYNTVQRTTGYDISINGYSIIIDVNQTSLQLILGYDTDDLIEVKSVGDKNTLSTQKAVFVVKKEHKAHILYAEMIDLLKLTIARHICDLNMDETVYGEPVMTYTDDIYTSLHRYTMTSQGNTSYVEHINYIIDLEIKLVYLDNNSLKINIEYVWSRITRRYDSSYNEMFYENTYSDVLLYKTLTINDIENTYETIFDFYNIINDLSFEDINQNWLYNQINLHKPMESLVNSGYLNFSEHDLAQYIDDGWTFTIINDEFGTGGGIAEINNVYRFYTNTIIKFEKADEEDLYFNTFYKVTILQKTYNQDRLLNMLASGLIASEDVIIEMEEINELKKASVFQNAKEMFEHKMPEMGQMTIIEMKDE